MLFDNKNPVVIHLLKKIDNANIDHFSFASFVQDAEDLRDDRLPEEIVDEFIKKYNSIWFDMEMINSAALSDWENSGEIKDWSKEWSQEYKSLASEQLAKLKTLLLSL